MITSEVAKEYFIQGHIRGKENNINKYLIDLTKANFNGSLMSVYQLAHNDLRRNKFIDHKAITALLVNPNDHSHDHMAIIAQNNGQHVKIVNDRDAAISFLNAWVYP